MRYLFSVGVAGSLCIAALLGFWRVHVTELVRESGELSQKVDSLVALWKEKGIAPGDRVADIVLSDADAEAFALAEAPSAWDRLADGAYRALWRRSMSAEETPFAKAFADDAAAVTWTHEGFATVSEGELTLEVMKAVVKLHAAGARVNIVAQGVGAAAALRAVKALEGAGRGQAQAGVARFVAVGMNRSRLRALSPGSLGDPFGPVNLGEWADIWTTVSAPRATVIELRGPGGKWLQFAAEDIMSAQGGIATQDLIRLVRDLLRDADAMERTLGRMAQAEAQKRTVVVKNHEGHYFPKELPAPAAAPAAHSSLDFIKGGSQATAGPAQEPAAARLNGGKPWTLDEYIRFAWQCGRDEEDMFSPQSRNLPAKRIAYNRPEVKGIPPSCFMRQFVVYYERRNGQPAIQGLQFDRNNFTEQVTDNTMYFASAQGKLLEVDRDYGPGTNTRRLNPSIADPAVLKAFQREMDVHLKGVVQIPVSPLYDDQPQGPCAVYNNNF